MSKKNPPSSSSSSSSPRTANERSGERTARPRRDHHLHEWSSGQRGGGKVPADFGWRTNPKQWQEENGAANNPSAAPKGGKKKT